MKKIIIITLIAVSGICVYGQRKDVVKAMLKYKMDTTHLDVVISKKLWDYSFNMKTYTSYADGDRVELASYDPRRKGHDHYELHKVNDQEPTSKELNYFYKEHNGDTQLRKRLDEDQKVVFAIEKDLPMYLVVRFRYRKSTLRKKDQFLADCHGLAYFNKLTGYIEKAEFTNDEPIFVKMLSVDQLHLTQTIRYDESEKMYFIDREVVDMTAKVFGMNLNVYTTNRYYDYKKVR